MHLQGNLFVACCNAVQFIRQSATSLHTHQILAYLDCGVERFEAAIGSSYSARRAILIRKIKIFKAVSGHQTINRKNDAALPLPPPPPPPPLARE
mmetsp:Transcript_3397/g.5705  ORF Transcript_3397/g.5705 Transcript_3397/m.5705 type:complete len:95 (-) Transcript_3397:47-331(-)